MIFILDTNVVSAMMLHHRVPEVADWLAAQDEREICTTAITQAEIQAGIALLPEGRKRASLAHAADKMLAEFADRILVFESGAGEAYADIVAAKRRAGRAERGFDLLIAAIARNRGAAVVTRDEAGFAGCGLTVINPWSPK